MIFLVSIIAFVFADGNSNSTNSTLNTTLTANETAGNFTRICDKINDIVQEKLNRFDDGKVRRINAYNNTEDCIQKLIDRLNQSGVNTTTINSDFNTLKADIDNFNANYSVFITKLKSLQNYTCGSSQGDFVAALRDAKLVLPVLRSDSVKIRADLQKIMLDLRDIRLNRIENRTAIIRNRTGSINYSLRNMPRGNRT